MTHAFYPGPEPLPVIPLSLVHDRETSRNQDQAREPPFDSASWRELSVVMPLASKKIPLFWTKV